MPVQFGRNNGYPLLIGLTSSEITAAFKLFQMEYALFTMFNLSSKDNLSTLVSEVKPFENVLSAAALA